MTRDELKTEIIKRISDIDDIHLLESINRIIDSGTDNNTILLTNEQLKEISSSKKDMEEGLFLENKMINKEVKLWLKRR